MKTITVVGAAIVKKNLLFIAQRPDKGEVGLKWEFPGGKLEIGETPEQAIVREIKEELSTSVSVIKKITHVEHDYQTFHLSMDIMLCKLTGKEPTLSEHVNSKWISKDEINNFDWAPADLKVLDIVSGECFE